MSDKKSNEGLQKISEDVSKVFENCMNFIHVSEVSRVTGVRMELFRRLVKKTARDARAETWDKIYPTLKPYLEGPTSKTVNATRIGPAYRRHNELIDMVSDQKVLLDEFAILTDKQQQAAIAAFEEAAGTQTTPTSFKSLNTQENKVMGAYLAIPEEKREVELLKLTEIAIAEVQKRRRELF
jgi:hypothetical protein